MIRRNRRHFAAVLEPRRIHLVEYRRRGSVVESVGPVDSETVPAGVEAAAEQLAARIEARGGRGGDVVVAVRGFGIASHLLQLPPADAEVWTPIVEREAKRLEPGLEDAVVSFSACGSVTRGANQLRELLVGMAQPSLLDALGRGLAQRRIELKHVTVVPQAVRRAYDTMPGAGAPSVVVLLLDSGPVIGFFVEGELRLVVEPPLGGGVGEVRAQVLHDAIERGMIHLRQQHRGLRTDRIMIAAPPGEHEAVVADLRRQFADAEEFEVHEIGSVGAFLGVGVVQDSLSDDCLDLSGRPRARSLSITPLRMALAGAAAAALVWALAGALAAWLPARESNALDRTLAARMDTLGPIADVLVQRRAHEQRIAYVASLDSEYLRLEQVLRELGGAMPGGVRLDSLSIERSAAEWSVQIGGGAYGATAAEAVAMLHSFDSAVRMRLNARDVELAEFTYLGFEEAALANADAGVRFRLSFNVDAAGAESQ